MLHDKRAKEYEFRQGESVWPAKMYTPTYNYNMNLVKTQEFQIHFDTLRQLIACFMAGDINVEQ